MYMLECTNNLIYFSFIKSLHLGTNYEYIHFITIETNIYCMNILDKEILVINFTLLTSGSGKKFIILKSQSHGRQSNP